MTTALRATAAISRRRVGLSLLGLTISVAALWLCLRSVDIGEVARLMSRAQPAPILAFLAVLGVQTLVRAVRWSLLLPRHDGLRIPASRTLAPLLVGYLGNIALPARLGEPIRALLVARREDLPIASAIGSVVLERVVDTATLALIVLPAAWHVGAPAWITNAAVVAAVVSCLLLVILSFIGLARLLRAADAIASRVPTAAAARVISAATVRLREFIVGAGTADRRPVLIAVVGLCVLVWAMDATLIWLVAHALGWAVDPAEAVLIAGAGVFATMIPAAPGYVGTYELAVSTTAVALGVGSAGALALAVATHGLVIISVAAAGLVSLVVVHRDWRLPTTAASSDVPDDDKSLSLPTSA